MALEGLTAAVGERGERRGSVALVLLVAAVLVAAATGLIIVGRGQAGSYVMTLLAILGVLGVFSILGLAAGIFRVTGRDSHHAMMANVLEHAQDGIAVIDRNGQVLYANAAYRAFAEAREDADVRPLERVFVGDPDVSEAVYRLLKAAKEGRRLEEEVRIAGCDGNARWLRLRVRPLGTGQAKADEPQPSVWTVADVTRERDGQENVFQELKHAIDYLDHAPAGFFSVDGQGDIGYVNATLAGWLDYELAQIGSGGLRLSDILPGDGAALLTALAGRPGEVKTEIFDLDLSRRDGRPLPVRLYHKVAFAGAPGASRTLVLNRSGGEEADPLRAAEVRFMRFFNNTPMAIATIDRQSQIVRTNALFARMFQALLKGEASLARGRSIRSVIAERDAPALDEALTAAWHGRGDIAPIDAAFAGEGERWGRFYVTPVEEAERDSEAAIVYAIETTGQRVLQRQLDQSQKMDSVGKLAGGIAHDFNNVLSSIMMATDFLLTKHPSPSDPSFQDIDQIKQDANRAASLVRQLLAFSRRQTLRPQVLDLGDSLSDLTMLLRRLIGERVTLDYVPPGRGLWPVKADLSQFEQVIVNLAVNARDAMPDGGKLTLRTSNVTAEQSRGFALKGMPPGEYVLVEVTDTGTGIPPEIIDQVFEPFFSTKEVGKGTGLGLSTVYGIVKQTGGFVYPDSIVGKGTTFRIFLPRHVPVAEEPAPADSPVPAGASMANAGTAEAKSGEAAKPTRVPDDTGQGTILLVEDEAGLRGLNARGLVSRGYTVLQAANGTEAIEAFDRHGGKVDLVVSDVVMPEMDGPTLLTELRRRDADVKIVFVSGYAEEAFEKHLPEGEKYSFLAKPFTLKQLIGAVKEMTDK
jgi:two-component system cell cycle sensor histidine kinase/response regulator CckA